MVPEWLHDLSIAMLCVGAVCSLFIVQDELRHPQHMWIMNLVWPVTALFGGAATLWGYFRYGRLATRKLAMQAKQKGEEPPSKRLTPFPAMVGKAALHCGSGCTLGDIIAEWLVFLAPSVAAWAGWTYIFPDKIFAVWVVDYLFAFGFGIAFQYFTITPMRGLSPGEGLVQAVKADTLSLTSWQLGMYGFMALAHFWIFGAVLGVKLTTDTPEFWFMMQIAMLFGFLTAYPVNWLLLKIGVKETM